MAEDTRATGATTPGDSGVTAEVNAPQSITMYDLSGRSIQVGPGDITYWEERGFTRFPFSVTEEASNLLALMTAAAQAVQAFVDGVTRDGVIDPSDQAQQATATLAMREVEQAWYRLRTSIEQRYPMREAEPATLYEQRAIVGNQNLSLLELAMLEPQPEAGAITYEWAERKIDPTQVDMYLARRGWSRQNGGSK